MREYGFFIFGFWPVITVRFYPNDGVRRHLPDAGVNFRENCCNLAL